MKFKWKWLGWGAASLSSVIVGLSTLVGWQLTHPKNDQTDEDPSDYNLEYENVSFNSKNDEVKLSGWWIPNENSRKTVIMSHGYGDERSLKDITLLKLSKRLHNEGYNVLMFDFRNSGSSEGNTTGVGYFERYDLEGAIDFAKNKKKSEHIALMGWSMGASTSILAGSTSNDVSVIIADSPFSDLKTYLEDNLPYWSKLPKYPFTPAIMTIMPVLTGMDPTVVSPVNAVAESEHMKNKSILLIHSKDDKAIPYSNSEDIKKNIKGAKHSELWITEGADHIRSYNILGVAYEEKIVQYLNQHLN